MSGPSVGPAERGARYYYYDYLPAAGGVGGARRTPLYHVALGGGARLHKGRAHTRFVRAPDACIDESAKRTLPRLIEHDRLAEILSSEVKCAIVLWLSAAEIGLLRCEPYVKVRSL